MTNHLEYNINNPYNKYSIDKHLKTTHLENNLKGRTIQGSSLTIISQGIIFVLRLGAIAILARLLMPEAFGLISMVLVIVGFAEVFKEAGLSMATVQRSNVTHEQVSTLFWVNIAISSGIMLLVAASSPLISWFYSEPRLTEITIVVSLAFFFSGIAVQHQALLRRQMRFGILAGVNMGSIATGIIVGVGLALHGFGYWSLVGMHLAQPVANTILVWKFCGWRPGAPKRGVGVRPMLFFGGNLTLSNFLNYCTRNVDNLLIGAVCGASSLGLYTKAYRLLMLPIQQLNSPVSAAAMPALSRLQNDPERFKQFYLKGISYLTFFGMPLVVFCFIAAEEIIRIVLGPGWEGSVPIFRALAPAALLGTFNVATGWIFVPLGRTDRQVKCTFFGSIITMIAFFIGIHWGPIGVAIGFSIGAVLKKIPQIFYAYMGSPLKMLNLLKAIWKQMLSAIVGAFLCYLILQSINNYPYMHIIIYKFIIYITCYFGLFLLLPKSFHYVKELVSDIKILAKNKA